MKLEAGPPLSNDEAPAEQVGGADPPRHRLSDIPRAEAFAVLALLAALGWAYAPEFRGFYEVWSTQPDYTHGFLVVPISLFIFWKLWPDRVEDGPKPWAPAWALVLASLAARAYFAEQGQNWLESATLLLVVFGLGMSRIGPRAMSRVWPAFAYLAFLYPLPPQLNTALSQPLQGLATTCACALLKLTGLWVMPEGNVILVGNERLEVAAACNGLSMLMSLAATVAAAASLVPMANWKRILLLLSIIPIALSSNVLRIAATAWCYYAFGADVGSKYAHDAAGWLMMPVAMILVGLELLAMSWVVIEVEDVELTGDRLGLARLGGGPIPSRGGRP